jgi:hypothetical protein
LLLGLRCVEIRLPWGCDELLRTCRAVLTGMRRANCPQLMSNGNLLGLHPFILLAARSWALFPVRRKTMPTGTTETSGSRVQNALAACTYRCKTLGRTYCREQRVESKKQSGLELWLSTRAFLPPRQTALFQTVCCKADSRSPAAVRAHTAVGGTPASLLQRTRASIAARRQQARQHEIAATQWSSAKSRASRVAQS